MDLKGAILRNFYEVGTLVTQPNPEEFFSLKVPHYQRPYKWDKERVEQLILDWFDNKNSSEDSDQDYFAGAVVTVADPKKYEEHSLIDGQQRITTLFLTNYINFIVIRALILSEIDRKRCGRIESLSEALRQSAKFLFRDQSIVNNFEKAAEKIKEYSDDDKMDELHDNDPDNPAKEFYDLLWMPQFTFSEYEDPTIYKRAVTKLLEQKIHPNALNLHYDRTSFNSSLVKTLSHFHLDISSSTPKIEPFILDEEFMSGSEKVYTAALVSIVETFTSLIPKDATTRTYLPQMHNLITDFLNQIKLCVIQTGATDDAYTLFEVMNDRALELDDLDLIKNQFFKEFVQKNKLLSEDSIDQQIQALDKQWGDDIFNHANMRSQDKKLVTYFTTVFLTGDVSTTNNRNEKYRIYLSDYLKEQEEYDSNKIHRDFNIFQVCFELIKILKLPLQRREAESLVAEYDTNSTDFKKAMFFLNALKQDGVISGLVNFLLKSISKFNPSFETKFSCNFIKLLLDKNYQDENTIKEYLPRLDSKELGKVKESLIKIQKQSKSFWITSLMSPNAEAPRDLAKMIIKSNNISENPNDLEVIMPLYDKFDLKGKFTEWLKQWNYEKDHIFKIKTLFARLLKFDLQEGQLVDTPVKMMIDESQIRSLDLDHLVAINLGDDGIFSFDNEDRDLYIHSLGNMMPLPKKENIQKSDYPLEKSLKYYELSGLSKHFLLDEIKELLKSVNNSEINQLTFFSKRKEDLINYFNEIVIR